MDPSSTDSVAELDFMSVSQKVKPARLGRQSREDLTPYHQLNGARRGLLASVDRRSAKIIRATQRYR